MEDVIESVENLISILQNLNSLNYEDISILLIPLLKSNYYGENMKVLLELYFKNSSEKSFIDLCKELLNYEYISKYSFMNSMLNENMSCIKNYQFIHEIISPTTTEELEASINKFISQDNDNKENITYNMSKYNKRTSQNYIYLNETTKKSKFQSKDRPNSSSKKRQSTWTDLERIDQILQEKQTSCN